MLELFYYALLLVTFTSWFALTLFKREMKNKSKYKEYIEDAIDGIENNFSRNSNHQYTSCSGIAFFKNKDNEIEVISQSKLCSTSINY